MFARKRLISWWVAMVVAAAAALAPAASAHAAEPLEVCKAAIEKASGLLARLIIDYEAARGDLKRQAEIRAQFAEVSASVAPDRLPPVTDPAVQRELDQYVARTLRPIIQRWNKIAAAPPASGGGGDTNGEGKGGKAGAAADDPRPADKADGNGCFPGATPVKAANETYCVTPQHKKHGVWTHWYAAGKKKAESTYRHGLRHGARRLWSPDGRLREEEGYADDEPDGVWTKWNASGKKTEELRFRKGKRHGTCQWFTDGGKPKESIEYEDDKRHGLTRRWHSNGTLAEEARYRHGKAEGAKTQWSPIGAVIAASCWNDDREVWHTADPAKLAERPCK